MDEGIGQALIVAGPGDEGSVFGVMIFKYFYTQHNNVRQLDSTCAYRTAQMAAKL
ncbi:hypothetical protein ACKFKF_33950 [Phormidesmis sp. 146-12]